MYYLSLDFGTSSVKAAVLDSELNCLKTAKASYELMMTGFDNLEIDPKDVLSALEECLCQIEEYKNQISIICYDTFAPSVLFMNQQGEPVYPIITHLDRRSRRESKQVLSLIDKNLYLSITGVLPFAGGVSLTTILWMKNNRKHIYDTTYKIGHLSTYLYKYLTGEWATDPVNASMTGLYETVKYGDWSKMICEKIGVSPSMLPPIKNVGPTYSRIRKEIADEFGLRSDVKVFLGTQDIASAQVGANNHSSGDILFISGSSEMTSILTHEPLVKETHYLRCAVTPGLWQIFSITTGGFAIEWMKEQIFRDMSHRFFYDVYFEDVLKNRFSTKLVKYNSHLTGDRHSLRKKRGSFSGLTLDTDRDNMFCALLEGIQKPALQTYNTCIKAIKLNKKAKITGNLVEASKSYLEYKQKIFGDLELEITHNGPIIGNAIIVRNSLNLNDIEGDD